MKTRYRPDTKCHQNYKCWKKNRNRNRNANEFLCSLHILCEAFFLFFPLAPLEHTPQTHTHQTHMHTFGTLLPLSLPPPKIRGARVPLILAVLGMRANFQRSYARSDAMQHHPHHHRSDCCRRFCLMMRLPLSLRKTTHLEAGSIRSFSISTYLTHFLSLFFSFSLLLCFFSSAFLKVFQASKQATKQARKHWVCSWE